MFNTSTLTPVEVEEIVKKYNSREETLTSLAKRLGCSVPTVGRLLKKHGAVMRPKGRPTGSKTVNRKSTVAAVTPQSEVAETDTEKPATQTPATDFLKFQQKVLQFNK